MQHQSLRREARFDGFELDAAQPTPPGLAQALERQPGAPVRVRAGNAGSAAPLLEAHADRPRQVRLDVSSGAAALPPDVTLVVSTARDLESVGTLPNPVDVELNADSVSWLRSHREWVAGKGALLGVFPQLFLKLETALREQVDLRAVLAELPLGEARLINIPACLSGRDAPSRAEYFADESLLREVEDVPAHARHYYWKRYMTKSARCRDCALQARCSGVHINYARQFGYRQLVPVSGSASGE